MNNEHRLNIFGLCIKHRESINEIDPLLSTLETNHPRERWLKIEPMKYHQWKHDIFLEKWKRGEASSTFWSFPPKYGCNMTECDKCLSFGPQTCAECACGGGRCAECGCFV